jgi:cystathionine beta-lyase/cystathionine gamma-synthase
MEAVIALGRKARALCVVDNTFLSPYFQRPLEFGADMVVHSTTKYLNGHSDVVGGAVIYGSRELQEKGRSLINALGVSQSPYDAWLVLRGIKTLVPRMEAHQANAMKVALFLEGHRNVRKVYYPGLASHPQQGLIKKQMHGFGGMLAFELNTRRVALNKFFKKLRYFSLAESLGGVESLVETPWYMSHASMGKAGLTASGITKETIRVSVGIEDAGDLIDDLGQALKG